MQMELMQMHCKQRIIKERANMEKDMVTKEKITMGKGIKVRARSMEIRIKVHKVIKVIRSPILNQEEIIMGTKISIEEVFHHEETE